MNYYEHHMGDYLKATAHLSALEDCFYRRALDWYYSNERPLPADVSQVTRLLRAQGGAERKAVAAILSEFFSLEDDGWHNKRADEEIAEYNAGAPDREAKKANDAERKRRSRERRSALFESLREKGVTPAYDTPTSELVTLLSRVTGHGRGADGTATQSPDTSEKKETPPNTHGANPPVDATRAGVACARMKREGGLLDVNPNHPILLELLAKGVTGDELVEAAKLARSKNKNFAYALAACAGMRRDAAAIGDLPDAPGPTAGVRRILSPGDRVRAAAAAEGIDLGQQPAGRVFNAVP